MLIRILTLVFLFSNLAAADAGTTKNHAKLATEARRRAIAESAVGKVTGTRDSVFELKLHKDPIYKYHEVERGFHHATTWMWTGDKGRPALILNLSGSDELFYEFMSLTNARVKFDVSDVSWTPKNGWEPKPVPKAPSPGRSRAIRLGQMRSLARKFSAYQVDYEKQSKKHHLRLLTQPVYRYGKESNESLDGALFAFVRNGDLEIILTIEAAKTSDGNAEWVFDCDRVATFEQHVAYEKREVWSCIKRDFGSTADDYYVKIVDLKKPETAAN